MYFTQEDYQKIEKYFKERAYKDTDFHYINPEDVLDSDSVAIVHRGTNKRITIKDITDRVASEVGQVDDHLSHTSVKPVQNKVVTGALDDKVDDNAYLTYWNVNKIIFDVFGF